MFIAGTERKREELLAVKESEMKGQNIKWKKMEHLVVSNMHTMK